MKRTLALTFAVVFAAALSVTTTAAAPEPAS